MLDAPLVGDQYPRLLVTPGSALRRQPDNRVDVSLGSNPDNRAVVSLASEAIDLAALAGLELDPWQCLVLEQILTVRQDTYWNPFTNRDENRWAAAEFGLVVSRQNGKGSILEARELAGLFLFGERKIIHSAHLFDTSREAFKRIKFLIENTPELSRHVSRISNSHGDEGIFLKSGQELLFKARTKGGTRGFSGDLVVLDEAMARLGSEEVEAILPTVSARPNGQLLYFGSAGTQESEHFGRARNRALKVLNGGAPESRFGWMEWSAELHNEYCETDCELHDSSEDPKTWAKTNPALGFRISLEHIEETEFKAMSPAGFAKERLSVGDWPVEGGGWRVLPKTSWDERSNPLSQITGTFALALDTAPNASWSCITACGANKAGDTHVEVTSPGSEGYDYRPGTQWAVERIKEIWQAFKPPFVVIDPASPAGSLILELESYGVVVKTVTARDIAQGCGDFLYGIAPKSGETAHIRHLDQAPLNAAAAAADKLKRQDLWIWSSQEAASDITPLRSATLAVWAYKTHIYRKTVTPWFSYGD